MFKYLIAGCVITGVFIATASAHTSITSGPAPADKSAKLTFGIGHGCEDASGNHYDTLKVRIEIPAGVTSVRALTSDFGRPSITKTGTQVTAIEWTRPESELLPDDDAYYEISIRARMPNAPYSQLTFNVHQVCLVEGVETTLSWNGAPGSASPAPLLTLVPARANATGWTKLTIPAGMTVPADRLGIYFGDALIVWRGTAAFSSNANTAALISSTSGVTALATDLVAGDEIWVRY
jgi:periplasmic copper chaperone A